MNVKQK